MKLAVPCDIPFWQVSQLLEHDCQPTFAISCLLSCDFCLMIGSSCVMERVVAIRRRVPKMLVAKVCFSEFFLESIFALIDAIVRPLASRRTLWIDAGVGAIL